MHKGILLSIAILGGATLAQGAEKSVEQKAHAIIGQRCTGCHNEERINAAFAAGKDMKAIERAMEKKGAKLTNKEKSTLDFYWKQSPVLK